MRGRERTERCVKRSLGGMLVHAQTRGRATCRSSPCKINHFFLTNFLFIVEGSVENFAERSSRSSAFV